ncbi:MAG TPA: exodeoxyribonuclease VII large subunit, partial [Anaerolineae bacterium]|nr:exodeoxyribonuclease VII large subunit [Anaerolineae bacterium]
MQLDLFSQPETLTVSALTRYIREMIEMDYRLQDVWVQGEISNLSRPGSGHVYFSLKDSGAALKCVMWRTAVTAPVKRLRDGDAIVAHGKLSVYEAQGAYQLYVDAIQTAGVGDLYQQFERLKAQLQAEGLFAPDRKRPLPATARVIGIVTSPTGAALQDMLN